MLKGLSLFALFALTAAAAPRTNINCLLAKNEPSWCDSIEPYRCYHDADVCCKTCALKVRVDLPAAIIDTCPYGDRLAAAECLMDLTSPYRCYQDAENCCGTCAKVCLNVEGCEYGDKAGWCSSITAQQCYDTNTAETCCKTCGDFRRGVDSCAYGDYVSGCTVSDCTDRTRMGSCCETCMGPNVAAAITAKSYNYMYSCPGEDAYWCRFIEAKDCYNHPDSCCNTCRTKFFTYKMPAAIMSMSCRNKASWCTNLEGAYCYDASTRSTCCAQCSDLKVGPLGCEYGDEMAQCMEADCADPTMRKKCCRTCGLYNLVYPQPMVVLSPQNIVGKSGKTSIGAAAIVEGRPTVVISPKGPAAPLAPSRFEEPVQITVERDGPALQVNEECVDQNSWCHNVKPHECYHPRVNHTCCRTCFSFEAYQMSIVGPASYRTGAECRYGNKFSWCSEQYCNTPANIADCCGSCAMVMRPGMGIAPGVMPQRAVTGVLDSCTNTAGWCIEGFHGAYCYNQQTRDGTCCYACATIKDELLPQGCEYGDKKTWCDTIRLSGCSNPDIARDCCKKCRAYAP